MISPEVPTFFLWNCHCNSNTYSFLGEMETSKHEHWSSLIPTPALTVLTTHSYDHIGRLVYNEIGQLKQKDLHVSGNNAAQEILYSYNERGWTTSINNPNSVTDKRRFGMTLNYANGALAYNGNIDSVQWNTKVSSSQTQTPLQTYTYTYDRLNRLKRAAYSATGKNNFFNEELAYDVMGNIDTLRRSHGSTGWYNHFKYHYTGNKLNSVSDAGSSARSNSFTYDLNGNAITNNRLGITNIEYNYLNLPKKFVKGSQQLVYTYDATGRKLKKELGSAVTDYVDGIQYKNGAIEFIQTEEGRILPSGSSFIYEYFLQDHLGNTRAIVDHTGSVKQIQDYYAFGMEMNTGGGLNSASNQYKYNGKEKQVELGLDQLDYGARFYDAEIGRWNVVDPLAELMRRHSSYNYAFNNPIRFIDPDGRGPNDFVRRGDGSIYWDKDANDQASTKAGEEYLGKTLAFTFNSYIDAKLWDGPMGDAPAGDKLTTTVYVTGNENSSGELTSISAGKHVTIGETPMGTARDFYPGLGKDQNKFSATAANGGFNVNMEQHASVSPIEQAGMNAMGFNIVNVAQKLNVNINSQGNVSVSAFTDVFPSASLSVNGSSIMKYNQPSFRATHGASVIGYGGGSAGFAPVMPKPIYDIKLKPAAWYKRY